MTRTHILLVEDDARIAEIVEQGMTARGVVVTRAHDVASAVELGTNFDVDLVLLDLGLPDGQGTEVLQRLRRLKPRLPFIALTARDDLESKIGSLEAGVDDYITKPFSLEELAARVRARLRWREEASTILKVGGLTVDLAAHRVLVDHREVRVSARELTLLATFMTHPGQVLTRSQLLRIVWDIDFDTGSNVVDVHVAALRRKIGADVIETVRGVGYRLAIGASGAGS